MVYNVDSLKIRKYVSTQQSCSLYLSSALNMFVKLYDTFTVRDVLCDNVKITNVGDDVFVATFGFNDRCGLYGELLSDVKRDHRIRSCTMHLKCNDIRCKPMTINGDTAARGPSAHTGKVTDQSVRDLYESYPIFAAVVDVEFTNVSGELNESVDGTINMVLYESAKVTSISKLRSWNYDPIKRYGSLGVGQAEVNKIISFESTRDDMR